MSVFRRLESRYREWDERDAVHGWVRVAVVVTTAVGAGGIVYLLVRRFKKRGNAVIQDSGEEELPQGAQEDPQAWVKAIRQGENILDESEPPDLPPAA